MNWCPEYAPAQQQEQNEQPQRVAPAGELPRRTPIPEPIDQPQEHDDPEDQPKRHGVLLGGCVYCPPPIASLTAARLERRRGMPARWGLPVVDCQDSVASGVT